MSCFDRKIKKKNEREIRILEGRILQKQAIPFRMRFRRLCRRALKPDEETEKTGKRSDATAEKYDSTVVKICEGKT